MNLITGLKKKKILSKNKIEKGILSLIIGELELKAKSKKPEKTSEEIIVSNFCSKLIEANLDTIKELENSNASQKTIEDLKEEIVVLKSYVLQKASNSDVNELINKIYETGERNIASYFAQLKQAFPNGLDNAFASRVIKEKITKV